MTRQLIQVMVIKGYSYSKTSKILKECRKVNDLCILGLDFTGFCLVVGLRVIVSPVVDIEAPDIYGDADSEMVVD